VPDGRNNVDVASMFFRDRRDIERRPMPGISPGSHIFCIILLRYRIMELSILLVSYTCSLDTLYVVHDVTLRDDVVTR